MNDYIERGPGGYLGVDGGFVSRVFSRMFLDSDVGGMWVEELSANGPADKAGLKADDIILSLADIEITSEEALLYAVQTTNYMSPSETVVARVYREGEIVTLPIVLGVGEAIIWLTDNEPILDPSPFDNSLLR